MLLILAIIFTGLLAMVNPMDLHTLKLDYGKSVDEVFMDTTVELLQGSSGPEPYRYFAIFQHEATVSRPSWIFDFSSPAKNTLTFNQPGKHPHGSTLQVAFDYTQRSMTLKASLVDDIDVSIHHNIPHHNGEEEYENDLTSSQFLDLISRSELVAFLAQIQPRYEEAVAASYSWLPDCIEPLWRILMQGRRALGSDTENEEIFDYLLALGALGRIQLDVRR